MRLVICALALAACADDVDERPATFDYIWQAILVPNCATSGCHSALSQNSGKNFETREQALMNAKDLDTPLFRGVVRVDGEYQVRMPPDQPLPEADILLIERWVIAGRPEH